MTTRELTKIGDKGYLAALAVCYAKGHLTTCDLATDKPCPSCRAAVVALVDGTGEADFEKLAEEFCDGGLWAASHDGKHSKEVVFGRFACRGAMREFAYWLNSRAAPLAQGTGEAADDFAAMCARLVQRLRKFAPDDKLAAQATGLLARRGAMSPLREAPASVPESEEHPEARCEECKRPNVTWFAPSPLWNRVCRPEGYASDPMLCPVCFIRRAEAMGIEPPSWRVAPEFNDDVPVPESEDGKRIARVDLLHLAEQVSRHGDLGDEHYVTMQIGVARRVLRALCPDDAGPAQPAPADDTRSEDGKRLDWAASVRLCIEYFQTSITPSENVHHIGLRFYSHTKRDDVRQAFLVSHPRDIRAAIDAAMQAEEGGQNNG